MLAVNWDHKERNSLRDLWLPRLPLRSRGPSPSDGLGIAEPPSFPSNLDLKVMVHDFMQHSDPQHPHLPPSG